MTAIELSSYFGLGAITLLTLNILLGLLLSTKYNPVRNWPHRRINTLRLHNWTGYAALVVSLVHPVLILASPTAHFRLVDLVYPLNAPKQPYVNTIGATALYLLLVTVVTSHFRLEIGRRIWKPLHFATYGLFVLYAVHALLTDPNLKDAPFDPLDAEKVYVELCILLVMIGIAVRVRWQFKRNAAVLGLGLLALVAPVALRAQATTGDGWHYDRDAGAVYQRGDVKWTIWGFAERYWGPKNDGVTAVAWRRVRQGMEVDLPRLNGAIRPVFVYEVDLTNNNFFSDGRASRIFENVYLAVQNPNDAARFRALFGENTHILSREDNLSSGNLPTINRSLILEEHGSVGSFGTQWGVQFFSALSPRTSLALSFQDNRGSLNTTHPSYRIGNSVAAKVSVAAIRDTVRRRQLSLGIGLDYTRAIDNRSFVLATALGAEAIGSAEATGNKFTIEGDAAYQWMAGSHQLSVEAEYLFSEFSHSLTDVSGGSALFQASIFDLPRWGDLDPFIRYDVVRLGRELVPGAATQHAFRTGVNYGLPWTQKHLSVHVEYALNRVSGPSSIVLGLRTFGEIRGEVRINASRYLRH